MKFVDLFHNHYNDELIALAFSHKYLRSFRINIESLDIEPYIESDEIEYPGYVEFDPNCNYSLTYNTKTYKLRDLGYYDDHNAFRIYNDPNIYEVKICWGFIMIIYQSRIISDDKLTGLRVIYHAMKRRFGGKIHKSDKQIIDIWGCEHDVEIYSLSDLNHILYKCSIPCGNHEIEDDSLEVKPCTNIEFVEYTNSCLFIKKTQENCQIVNCKNLKMVSLLDTEEIRINELLFLNNTNSFLLFNVSGIVRRLDLQGKLLNEFDDHLLEGISDIGKVCKVDNHEYIISICKNNLYNVDTGDLNTELSLNCSCVNTGKLIFKIDEEDLAFDLMIVNKVVYNSISKEIFLLTKEGDLVILGK